MSPHRIADAAHIAPYPTHAIQHHGQQTSGTSDNASRTQKRPRNRERAARSEDGIRFNTGVPRSRMQNGRRRPPYGSAQSDSRLREDRYPGNEAPPPGYEEAISTPPLSGCPSTVTLAVASTTHLPSSSTLALLTAPVPDGNTHQPSGLSSRTESPHPPHSPASDSDSLSSVEIVEPSSTPVSHPYTQGRSTRNTTQLDLTSSVGDEHSKTNSKLSKRRNVSLSPLRTLFPQKASATQDAIHSDPSPTSPYSMSRSTLSPFRSTTSFKASLSTVSLGRFGLNDGSGHKYRKLFSFKGKARARDTDSWEMIDAQVEAMVDADGKVVALPAEQLSTPTTAVPKESPTPPNSAPPSIRGFTQTTPPTLQVPNSALAVTPVSPSQLSSPARTTYSRDEKVREMYLNLNSRRPPAPPPSATPATRISPASPLPETRVEVGPVLTTVRTRLHPTPPSTPKRDEIGRFAPSPCTEPRKSNDVDGTHAASEFQRALETPLPDTPIAESSYFSHVPRTPRASSERRISPCPSSRPAIDISTKGEMEGHSVNKARSTPLDLPAHDMSFTYTIGATESSTSPTTPTSIVGHYSSEIMSPMTLMRHHYPGRPLPRPPGARTARVIDSTYAPYEFPLSNGANTNVKEMSCPEGLLIDLDEEPEEQGTHTEVEAAGNNLQAGLREPSSTVSTTAFPVIPPTPSLAPTQAVEHSQFQADEDAPNSPADQINHSELTDLDMLVASLDTDARDGANYDALLLVSEFVGPASEGTGPAVRSNSILCNVEHGPPGDEVMLQGRIEVDRRRITRDGRRKLKLSLLGVGVERCTICMSQFREAEVAEMGPCKHVFHARCIESWLVKGSKTCPLCRTQLVD